jgi:hypothetical protein
MMKFKISLCHKTIYLTYISTYLLKIESELLILIRGENLQMQYYLIMISYSKMMEKSTKNKF